MPLASSFEWRFAGRPIVAIACLLAGTAKSFQTIMWTFSKCEHVKGLTIDPSAKRHLNGVPLEGR